MKSFNLFCGIIRCILFLQFTNIYETEAKLSKDVSRCVLDIYKRYFQMEGPTVVQTYAGWKGYLLNERNFTPYFEFEDALVGSLFATSQNTFMIAADTEYSQYFTNTMVKASNFIFVLDCGSIELQMHMIEMFILRIRRDLRNRASRLLIVSTYVFLSMKQLETFARLLLNIAWALMLNENSIILLPDVCPSYDNCQFVRFNVFSFALDKQSNPCSKLLNCVSLLDTWDTINKKFLANNNLFPDQKIKNMKNCSLDMFLAQWSPFIVIDYKGKSFYGPFAELLKTTARYINFQMEVTVDPEKVEVENSPYGIIGPAIMTMFGGFGEGQALNSYFMDDLSIYVPAGAQISKWKGLIRIFTGELWFLVAMTYFFGSVTFWLLSKPAYRPSYINALLGTMKTYLSMGITFNHTGLSISLFFIFWLCYCLVINTAYQSTLISFLVDPGESKPIGSLQELEESGIPRGRSVRYAYDDIIPEYILSFNDCTGTDCIDRIVDSTGMALVGGKTITDLIISSAYTKRGRPLIVSLPDWSLKAYLTFTIYLGDSFKRHFEFIVRTLKSAGILNKWDEEGILEMRKFFRTDLDEDYSPVLQLTHFQGPFYILLIGLAFAFLYFIIEKVKFIYSHHK
ncbi:Ionotropic receptor 903 [Blattella germanica]|nr:Ionotropic receptor 903 [Blattella germanica]